MRTRSSRSKGNGGGGGGDKTAIVANNCNNLVVGVLAISRGRQSCNTNKGF